MTRIDPNQFRPCQGIVHPLTLSGKTRVIDGVNYLRNGLVGRLDIARFELLMKPGGSRLRELLFEPLDDDTLDLVKFYVIEALRDFDQIEIEDAVVSRSNEENAVTVVVRFYIAKTDIRDTLRFDLTFTDPGEM